VLRALGYEDIQRFHLNEGHPALLTLELLDEEAKKGGRTSIRMRTSRQLEKSVSSPPTHLLPQDTTSFHSNWSTASWTAPGFDEMQEVFCCEGLLNMTYVGLNLSHYVNGVAKKHGETSRLMFAGYAIDAITNGVHAATWVSDPFRELYDRHISGWREDNFSLRYALSIPREEIWKAH